MLILLVCFGQNIQTQQISCRLLSSSVDQHLEQRINMLALHCQALDAHTQQRHTGKGTLVSPLLFVPCVMSCHSVSLLHVSQHRQCCQFLVSNLAWEQVPISRLHHLVFYTNYHLLVAIRIMISMMVMMANTVMMSILRFFFWYFSAWWVQNIGKYNKTREM